MLLCKRQILASYNYMITFDYECHRMHELFMCMEQALIIKKKIKKRFEADVPKMHCLITNSLDSHCYTYCCNFHSQYLHTDLKK